MATVAVLVSAVVALVLAVSSLRNMPDRRPPPHERGEPRPREDDDPL